jgi:hypothetical protein
MNKPVKLSDIIEGMEFASEETQCYLDRTTGNVVMVTSDALEALEDGEDEEEWSDLPEWQQEEYATARLIAEDGGKRFVALPDEWRIDEYDMMERYCRRVENDAAADELWRAIKGSGAFRRFKDTVHRLGLAEQWYRFKDEQYAELARTWCEENGVEYLADDRDE